MVSLDLSPCLEGSRDLVLLEEAGEDRLSADLSGALEVGWQRSGRLLPSTEKENPFKSLYANKLPFHYGILYYGALLSVTVPDMPGTSTKCPDY